MFLPFPFQCHTSPPPPKPSIPSGAQRVRVVITREPAPIQVSQGQGCAGLPSK